jgi:hypothetical protein
LAVELDGVVQQLLEDQDKLSELLRVPDEVMEVRGGLCVCVMFWGVGVLPAGVPAGAVTLPAQAGAAAAAAGVACWHSTRTRNSSACLTRVRSKAPVNQPRCQQQPPA